MFDKILWHEGRVLYEARKPETTILTVMFPELVLRKPFKFYKMLHLFFMSVDVLSEFVSLGFELYIHTLLDFLSSAYSQLI